MLFTAPVKCLTHEEAIQMYDRAIYSLIHINWKISNNI